MAPGLNSERTIRRFIRAGIVALIAITGGVGALNVEGAWIASGGNLPYTVTIGGVELLAAVSLTLALLNRGVRRLIGLAIFASAVWVCIQNGKFSIHHHFASMFPERPDVLEAKAALLEDQAALILKNPEAARTGLQITLDRKISEKAAAEAEVDLMTDATRISESQTRLQALGLYQGRIDGIADKLTEEARRKRGADLNRSLVQLSGEIRELESLVKTSAGGEGGVLGLKMEATNLRGQAKTAREGTTWMYQLLIAVENARSFGFWAFGLSGGLLVAGTFVPPPAPSAPWWKFWAQKEEKDPAPRDKTPEPGLQNGDAPEGPGLSPQQLAGHLGGSATAHGRAAASKTRIPIGPTLTVDARAEIPEDQEGATA